MRWLFSERRVPRNWREEIVRRMNLILAGYNQTLPKEIHRKIRGFKHIHFWKGTEYHTFLCYVGVVLLKDFLCAEEYEHFLKLFCATAICLTNKYRLYLPKARELFREFVEESIEIYGQHSINSNMHNLIHIADDVERFGELNSISSYEFENKLRHIKLKIKQCNKPLEQVARRLSEQKCDPVDLKTVEYKIPELKDKFSLPNSPRSQAFGKVKFKYFVLSRNKSDQWFLTKENDIVLFEYAQSIDGKVILHGNRLKLKTDFFRQPFSSRYLNIYISDCDMNDSQDFESISIKAKLFCLPYQSKHVFIPLLHTLDCI